MPHHNYNDTIADYNSRHDVNALQEYQLRDFKSDDTEFNESRSGFDSYIKQLKAQAFAKDFVSDITLPGHSSNGKESCGKWKLKGCLERDSHNSKMSLVGMGVMHCYDKGCNICFEPAITRLAHSIKNRMFTFANLKNNRKIYLKTNRVRILSHVVVSVPDKDYYKALTKSGRKELRASQRSIMKSLDVDGGCTILHPYRFTKNLENAYLSPHFHNIITGWIDGGIVKQIHEQTGWIVRQVSVLETEQEAYSLSAYLLSHAGVYEKEVGSRSSEQSVSYFGECQNSKFKVSEVLSKSSSGYQQLDKILDSKKVKTIKGVEHRLQRVHYTHSTISGSVKESINEYHVENGSIQTLRESMRQYIMPHIDNPAFSQSEPLKEQVKEPFQFLQMRFDYISPSNIVQSEYLTIILDTSIEELCPECSQKLRTLVPKEWSSQQAETFKEVIFPQLQEDSLLALDNDCGLQYLSRETLTGLGMPYFKLDGMMDYETGVNSRPECIDRLNPILSSRIIKNIDFQKFKSQFKQNNGMSPTKEEQQEYLTPTIKRSTISHRLSDY